MYLLEVRRGSKLNIRHSGRDATYVQLPRYCVATRPLSNRNRILYCCTVPLLSSPGPNLQTTLALIGARDQGQRSSIATFDGRLHTTYYRNTGRRRRILVGSHSATGTGYANKIGHESGAAPTYRVNYNEMYNKKCIPKKSIELYATLNLQRW